MSWLGPEKLISWRVKLLRERKLFFGFSRLTQVLTYFSIGHVIFKLAVCGENLFYFLARISVKRNQLVWFYHSSVDRTLLV